MSRRIVSDLRTLRGGVGILLRGAACWTGACICWTGACITLKISCVSLFSNVLDGLGRRYVAVPPVLIVMFLAALFLATSAGQARLRDAGARLEASSARQLRIDD